MDAHLYHSVARRGQAWTDEETSLLLDIWLDKFKGLNSSDPKNGHVYQSIANEINSRGFRKSALQCRTRMKTLKRAFKHSQASRRIGGLVGKLYRKIEKAVNLNRNEGFPSTVVYGRVEADGLRTVKSEVVSDSDSEQSNQDHGNMFAITVNREYDDGGYPRLASESGNSLQFSLNDVRKYSIQNDQSHGQQLSLQVQNTESSANQSNSVMSKEQHLVQTEQAKTPADQSYLMDSQKLPLVQTRCVETPANQSCLETNHNSHFSNPIMSAMHEQREVFGKDSNYSHLGTKTPPSFDRIRPRFVTAASPTSPPEHHRREDTKQTTTIHDDRCSSNSSAKCLSNTEQSFNDCVITKTKDSSNLFGEQSAKKRLDGVGIPLDEPHVISSNKEARSASYHCCSHQDDSNLNIPYYSPLQSYIRNDDEKTTVRSEVNGKESVSGVPISMANILDMLCSLQKSVVSIVAQQAVVTGKLVDAEQKRLEVRLKEAEVELLKQENEKERMAVEERQRREDREHHYKVMQLVLCRLDGKSPARESQNMFVNDGENSLHK